MFIKYCQVFFYVFTLVFASNINAQKQPTPPRSKTSTGSKSAESQKALFDKFFSLSEGDTAEFAQKTNLATAIFKGDSTSRYFFYVVTWASIVRKKFTNIEPYLAMLIEKNPDFAEAYYLKGQYLFYSKQPGYVEEIQKCIELNPKLSTPYYFLACDYYDLKNYKLSLTYYNLLEKADPQHSSLYYNRANTKAKLKDPIGAIEDFSQALKQKPGDYRILYNRADAYLELKSYVAAEKDLSDFIKLMPTYATAWYNRGLAKFHQTRPIEACDDFKVAVQLGYTVAADYVSKNCK